VIEELIEVKKLYGGYNKYELNRTKEEQLKAVKT
jgi:hypothetical protein